MENFNSGANAPQITTTVPSAYVPSKNPFDSRFNGHQTIIKDVEGNLYRIQEDFDFWFQKGNTTKEQTEILRNSGKKITLQEYWDKEDWEGFKKAWDDIESSTIKKVDVLDLKQSIDERKSILDKPAAFRTTEADQTDIFNLHLQTGWKADRIATEIGLGLPTVIKIIKKKKEDAENSKS